MGSRDPRAARTLGLWTASWLGALLVAGLLWVGELSVQWPVLLVPALWALVAVRPRRLARPRGAARPRGWDVLPATEPPAPEPPVPPGRTDTVERPVQRGRPAARRRYD